MAYVEDNSFAENLAGQIDAVVRGVRDVAGYALATTTLAGLAEVGLRLKHKEPPYSSIRYENDALSGPWALPSQVVSHKTDCYDTRDIHINRWGMRDREREEAASKLAGDSYHGTCAAGSATRPATDERGSCNAKHNPSRCMV